MAIREQKGRIGYAPEGGFSRKSNKEFIQYLYISSNLGQRRGPKPKYSDGRNAGKL
jgi:hypothetical protein